MDRIPFELFTQSDRFFTARDELTRVWRHAGDDVVFASSPSAIIVCDESLMGEQLCDIYDSPPHYLVEMVRDCNVISRSLKSHSRLSQLVEIPEIIKPKDVDEHWLLNNELVSLGEPYSMEPIQLGDSVIELESKDAKTVSRFSERGLWPVTQIKRTTFCYLRAEERKHCGIEPAARLVFHFDGGYGIVMPMVRYTKLTTP